MAEDGNIIEFWVFKGKNSAIAEETLIKLQVHNLTIVIYIQYTLSIYFTDRSKAVLLLWIFYVFVLSYVCYVFVRVCLFVLCGHLAWKGLTSWLSFVVSNCEFVTFPLVSWVGCGT